MAGFTEFHADTKPGFIYEIRQEDNVHYMHNSAAHYKTGEKDIYAIDVVEE